MNNKLQTLNSWTKLDIRPQKLSEFVGKTHIINSIRIGIEVAKKTNNSFDHCLIYGPPGVGKTSLAQIIANEMQSKIKIIQAVNVQSIADLMSLLNNIRDNDVIFIDEIHNLNKNIAEILYPAMEENVIDIMIGKQYNAKIVRLKLPKFTLIGATTNLGAISKPLEERFGYVFFIDQYEAKELKSIIEQINKYFNMELTNNDVDVIISNSRGIPRNCIRMIKRIHDHFLLKTNLNIHEIIQESGYFYHGLTEVDIKYLNFLSNSSEKTSSLRSITQFINLDEKTIVEKIEPFLIRNKFIKKTGKGRCITEEAILILEEYKKRKTPF